LIILNGLTNGLSYLGASKSVKLIANGTVLAAVILLDAWRTTRKNRRRGQRRELLAEWARRERRLGKRSPEMEAAPTLGRTFAKVFVGSVVCVVIVAICALLIHHHRTRHAPEAAPAPRVGEQLQHAEILNLKASDGQPLIWIDSAQLNPPNRPPDPTKLPDNDLLRWYDYEYAGWNVQKLPMPPSPGTGPRGKKVVSLQYMDHPYWQGYGNGMKRLAAAYGMDLVIMEAGNDNKVQADQVEQVIRMRPDLVILTPVDSNGVVPLLKRLHDERLPVIASNLIPVDEGMKYVICWTGPDDWGQFRMLAREFANLMHHQGGYCVVRHIAGTSCYLSRTWAPVSELIQIAPNMKCLDMQATDLKTEETKTQVSAWLKKHGSQLKGIISADDSKAMVGIVEALKVAGRDDVICVSAGSSRTGLTYIKEGKLHAVTYQSAEGDGALPIEIAARWFRGEKIERAIYYLKKHIINADNVDQFWPAQW
jgi:ribose transport system substrate-binding protein